MKEKYIVRYFLSASHYVVIDGVKSMTHPHNWQIELVIRGDKESIIDYRLLDNKVNEVLTSFEDKVINDKDEFLNIEATTENLGRILCEKLDLVIKGIEYRLIKFTISENASRSFYIELE